MLARSLAVAMLLCAATSAQAAPWSVELPDGYVEQPGAADAELVELRKQEGTVGVDAQVYAHPDGKSLTRMSWQFRLDAPATPTMLELIDKGVVSGAAEEGGKHISDTRQISGDQLVAESRDEDEGLLVIQRKLYAVDKSGVMHMLMVVCAGAPDKIADCEKAQQSMQLTLPNQAPLVSKAAAKAAREARNPPAYLIGKIVGGVLAAMLIVWLIDRARRRSA